MPKHQRPSRLVRLCSLLVCCGGLLFATAPTQAELLVTVGKGKSAISIADNSKNDLDPSSGVIRFDVTGASDKKGSTGYDVSGTVSLISGAPTLPGASFLTLRDFEATNAKGDGKGKLTITFSDTVFGPTTPFFVADSIFGSFQTGAGSSLSFQGFVDKSGIGSTFSVSSKKGGGPVVFGDLDTALITKGAPPWDIKGVLTVEVGKGDRIALPGGAQVAIGVPEPATATLFLLASVGFGVACWYRLRRDKRASRPSASRS